MDETQGWTDFDSYIGMARRAVNAELRVKELEAELVDFVECDEPSNCYIAGSKGSDMCTVYHKGEQ